MMIKNIKRAFVLGMTALVLFAGMPAPKVMAAENAPVRTEVKVSGGSNQLVAYRIYLDKTKVTDGRVAVEYDPEVLTLQTDNEWIKFTENDVNREYNSEDGAGISYAFVNDTPKNASGKLISLSFKAKPGIKGKDTTIKTTIFSINNEEETILSDVTLEDSFNVGKPLPKTPSGVKLGQTLIAFVPSWNKTQNATGYVVYRSDSKDGEYQEIGETFTTFFYDANVKNNTTYYYKVASYMKDGDQRYVSGQSEAVSGTIKKFFSWFN